MFKIVFKGRNPGEVVLEREAPLLGAAGEGSIALNHRCGGHCRCGTCLVTVEAGMENLSPVGVAEGRVLRVLRARADQRLGCQAWAKGDVTCRIE